TGVTLSLTGGVYGNVQLESLDATPALINYSLASQVTATGLSGLNVVVLPTASGTFSATAHDGTTDFAGGSGVSLTGLSNTASDTSTSTNGAVLAAYTGAGTFNVALAALGQSSSSGAGNLLASFNTNAGALVTVTYDYDDGAPAPEPATMVFVGAGLIAVGYFQRRGR
ncbi:MAG: choice-of-anchor E domain-containing protein, partial [Bryobacteraceae bacterium]|nr:choice-of-anchor E domain-containing protein [Bryobacteraceae bacterium]